MLNEKNIIASYKAVMASGKSKAARAVAIKAIPGINQLTDRFGWAADGRRNVATVAAALMSEIEYINAVHMIAVNIRKRNIKEARRVLFKIDDQHAGDFIAFTLDDVDAALDCKDYGRALHILQEIGSGQGVSNAAVVDALASAIK